MDVSIQTLSVSSESSHISSQSLHVSSQSLSIYTETIVTVAAVGFNNFEADSVDVKLGEINTLDVELLK